MPKLPSYKTIIAKPYKEDDNNLKAKHLEIIKKIKEVLNDKEAIKAILNNFPKESETTEYEAKEGRKKRIDAVLEKAGLQSTEQKEIYYEALSFSSSGYSIILARDIDELMVNSYNPEIA